MYRDPVVFTSLMLNHYSFELCDQSREQVIHSWLERYPTKWVAAAIVEAIYQGRYKTTSVNRILLAWQFRGQPLYHFDCEFADLICREVLGQSAIQDHKFLSDSTVEKPKSQMPTVQMPVVQPLPPVSTTEFVPTRPSSISKKMAISQSIKLVTKLQSTYDVA